jgi:multidrug efflux pump subunit AcrB
LKPVRRGIAGRLAASFLHSRLTPLMVIASALLGLLALLTLPREEEPQIQVPMVDVRLAWPGHPVAQVERQLTSPIERVLWQIPDLEYLYSTSEADGALLILRFKVGLSPDRALSRVRARLDESLAALPSGAAVAAIAPRSIDDVPVLALTLTAPSRHDWDGSDLRRVGEELATELRKTSGVSRVRVIGGESRVAEVRPEPGRMAQAGVSADGLLSALSGAGVSWPAGQATQGGQRRELRAESPLADADQLAAIAVPGRNGTVRLSEVATIADGPAEPSRQVWRVRRDGQAEPAVTVEVAKRPGVNATRLVNTLQDRLAELRGTLLTHEVVVEATRDLGETAQHKSDDLMFHLLLATLSVVALIALALGRREAVVVAIAIPVTLALTLFVYRFLGYTLNRVTLFALIFSIGILVDDAIVVVENVARHFGMRDTRDADARVVEAVDEVGNPTLLATFTVIAAILPLAFVGGLMGPYMQPIPIGASLAMLFSVGVAFAVSPWAARRLLSAKGAHAAHEPQEGRLDRLYRRVMGRLLDEPRLRAWFFAGVGALFLVAVSLLALRVVTVKMLPFDNKSEFEIVLDLPPGSTLETTTATALEAARLATAVPEVEDAVVHVGTGAPVTFNGLVRHYDFREDARFAEVQVRLVEAKHRKRQSHAVAKDVRARLAALTARTRARVKVVEVPPGPPVLSTLVAEVYGPDLEGQRSFARRVLGVFDRVPGVVDTDLMLTEGRPRTRFEVDRDRAAAAGVTASQVVDAAATLYGGREVGVLRAPESPEPVPVSVRLSEADRADLAALTALRMGRGTPLSELVRATRDSAPPEIHHKNLRRVVYVLGDVAGRAESPVYAIADLRPRVQALATPDGRPVHQLSTELPESEAHYSVKWDGEWHITYEVFRDMGAAFAVVLVLIYLLTVGWFQSFVTPFVIMLPIPLSLVGILPAHAMMGAFFTATSMIGFIAGAGITVRNSIILVDFIELRRRQGLPLRDAVIDAGAVRFRPMVLTAAAVVVGGGVILFDPIFQGLAVALIGGEVAATLLSRVTVPVLYYLARRGRGESVAESPAGS